jgi:hypothetical protein
MAAHELAYAALSDRADAGRSKPRMGQCSMQLIGPLDGIHVLPEGYGTLDKDRWIEKLKEDSEGNR